MFTMSRPRQLLKIGNLSLSTDQFFSVSGSDARSFYKRLSVSGIADFVELSLSGNNFLGFSSEQFGRPTMVRPPQREPNHATLDDEQDCSDGIDSKGRRCVIT